MTHMDREFWRIVGRSYTNAQLEALRAWAAQMIVLAERLWAR